MIRTLILIFSLLFGVLSCQKNEEKPLSAGPALKSEPAVKTKEVPSPHFLVRLRPEAKADVYTVELNWEKEEETPSHWILLRERLTASAQPEGIKHLVTLPPQTKKYSDASAIAGMRYRYFLSVPGVDPVIKEAVEIQIPKDMVIQGKQTITRIVGIHRLFLSSDAVLTTKHDRLRIEVDEIISEGGTLESFSEKDQAPPGIEGRNGGSLFVRCRTGKGIVHFVSRGEKGGRGMDGAKGIAGKPGAPGNGELRASKFGIVTVVVQSATDGGAGNPGGNGQPGFPGMRGGNSSRAYFEILDPSLLDIRVKNLPGDGGDGGHGGAPGEGGPGGEAGKSNNGAQTKPGAAGLPGERGAEGAVGLPGSAQPICLKLGTANYGDCDKLTISDGDSF